MTAGHPTERLIRELHDRALIRDLLMRYGRAVDRRDIDAVAACFAPDAEYDGSLGKGTVQRLLTRLRDIMPRYEKTMHLLAPQKIDVTGDTARCETHGIVYQRLREPLPRDRVIGVSYSDELTCGERGWLISKRVARIDWRRNDDDKAPPLAS